MNEPLVVVINATWFIRSFDSLIRPTTDNIREHISRVLEMDLNPCLESTFQILIACIPSYDLRVGTGKINLADIIAIVRYEEPTQVREGDCLGYH
jgi:hypothetical protein